jgi:uncharacterized membrane protein YdfJ with MMPL/SSD domain
MKRMKQLWIYLGLVMWVALSAVLFIVAPDMDQLVREKGQSEIAEHLPSSIAGAILVDNGDSTTQDIMVVYHEQNGLSNEQLKAIEAKLDDLRENAPAEFMLVSLHTPFDSEVQANTLISQDGTTILAILQLDISYHDVPGLREQIQEAVQVEQVVSMLTGSAIIDDDLNISAEQGLARTELVTVIFISIILLVVFRSLLAPIVPLVTVGASYILSISIVAFFIDWFNFPVSNFTQIFIVAVLFGIGTDYCILLLTRFKEALSQGLSKYTAMKQTYKAVGSTVIYSALTGFIGFAAIGLADFNMYQSAAGVAIGIVVLVLAIWVWVPAFMLIFGKSLFWPTRGQLAPKPNKLWERMGRFAVGKPVMTLLILALLFVPAVLSYNNAVSFNALDEVDESFESVYAFKVISEQFGEGETLPATLIIEHEESWKQQGMLPYIELLSQEIVKIEGVKEVRSATRPEGKKIEAFGIPLITNEIANGLDEAAAGLEQITELADGMRELSTGLRGIHDILLEIASQPSHPLEGFFVPTHFFDDVAAETIWETYLTPNQKAAKLTVIFDMSPYALEAIDLLSVIEERIEIALKGTPLENARYAINGVTSINRDLQTISNEDFIRTATIMLTGIFIVLVLLLRSLMMPLYLLTSLVLAYIISGAITEFIFINLLGYAGISWAVPFFAFVMLMALGVDYCIFLMGRFRESEQATIGEAMVDAMKHIGTVIISAAVILGGTFGAMIPSGMLSLMQIGSLVLVGLMLYAFLILPLFVPAMATLFGEKNWWPLGRTKFYSTKKRPL